MKQVINFLKNIKRRDHIIIVFHNDGDGICSCLLMKKYLEKKGVEPQFIISQPMPVLKSLVDKIKTFDTNKIIFLDLAIDQQEDIVKELQKYTKIMIIDHHKIVKKLKNVAYYNPRMYQADIYQSASYCVYKIVSKLTDMKNYLWVAIVGIISDFDVKDSLDLLEDGKRQYPDTIKSTKQEEIHKSFFGKLSDIINAAKASNRLTAEEIVKILEDVKDPKDITYTNKFIKLMNAYQEVEDELENIKANMRKKIEINKNIIFCELDTKYNIGSAVSTLISKNYPKKIVIVYQKRKNVKVNARSQNKKMNVATILRNAAAVNKKISAGGHEAAAGALVPLGYWEDFKNKLIKIVNK